MSEQTTGYRAKRRVRKQFSDRDLPLRQRMFALEYIKEVANGAPNATAAAERAGYRGKWLKTTALRLLQDPRIKALIEQKTATIMARIEISAEKVLQDIAETVERCKQATPVLDKAGEPVMIQTADGSVAPMYKFEPMAVLKGCELLGKHLKLFVERLEMKHVEDEIAKLSDEELAVKMKEVAQGGL